MADVLKFEPANPRRSFATDARAASREEFDFWPNVSRGLCAANTQSADPANSQGRVLTEMLTILGVTAAIAVAISLFAGTPPV